MTPFATKRLRFAYHPAVDESVCGAFTAACHDQRLRTVRSAIEGAGLDLPRPAHLQFADGATLAAAAAAMRTEPSRLEAVAFAPGPRRDAISLGDMTVPRCIIELERRRIAPGTLAGDPRHRSAWLNLLLPYCPESLEALVDACPDCGPLGWRFTRGIRCCERCGRPVPPSSEPPLEAGKADDYRSVADLLSRDAKRAERAMARLPTGLASYSRTAVANLTIQVAIVAHGARSARAVDALTRLEAADVAAAMCVGFGMVIGWPDAIRSFAEERTVAMGDDMEAYERLRANLKWVARSSEEGRDLISSAFPRIDGRSADTFAKETRYYTASETNAILWTASKELALLREAEAVDYEALPSKVRLRARYKADDIDALRLLLGDVIAPEAAASDLDLPTYAMEQLADEELVDVHDERGVVALRGPQLAARSVRTLIATLMERGIRSKPPKSHLRLRTALSAYPGEKPWGAALKAILEGRIPFHIADNGSVRTLAVDPSRLPDLPLPRITQGRLGIAHLPMRDAVELLASREREAAPAIKAGGGVPVPHRNGVSFARTDLAKLVARIAFTGEAAVHRNRNAIALHHEFTSIGVPRVHGAWCREALVELGMVRPFRVGDGD